MTRIYFTKRFTGGILKGLSINDSTWFDTPERASKAYHIGKRGRDTITRTPWVITDASFQKYDRS